MQSLTFDDTACLESAAADALETLIDELRVDFRRDRWVELRWLSLAPGDMRVRVSEVAARTETPPSGARGERRLVACSDLKVGADDGESGTAHAQLKRARLVRAMHEIWNPLGVSADQMARARHARIDLTVLAGRRTRRVKLSVFGAVQFTLELRGYPIRRGLHRVVGPAVEGGQATFAHHKDRPEPSSAAALLLAARVAASPGLAAIGGSGDDDVELALAFAERRSAGEILVEPRLALDAKEVRGLSELERRLEEDGGVLDAVAEILGHGRRPVVRNIRLPRWRWNDLS